MLDGYQEYQDGQIYQEKKRENTCNCFALFSKRERNFEDGISTSAYVPYVPRMGETPCIPDYSNPYAEAYIIHNKKQRSILRFCPVFNFFF